MPASLALFGCIAFIVWLFATDHRRHGRVSSALWIPLLWVLILGSKPISLWFGGDGAADINDLEGSPFDRLVFLLLIAAGGIVIARRRVNWKLFFRQNKWLCAFFIYLGISVLWSDYPFVSFKRWIKDAANILMVLIVLTEKNPLSAVKALLARSAYLLIPLSVLFIKYYPAIGRGNNRWPPYEVRLLGVTTDKNLLGMTLYVCALSLLWMFLSMRAERKERQDKKGMLAFLLLTLMTLWMLFKAKSSTALGCSILGIGVILAVQFPMIRSRLKKIRTVGIAAIAIMVAAHLIFNLGETVANALGRDLTFTGRTEIWKAVLQEDTNPIFGTGYYSFWLGDRVQRLSDQYYFELNEAHNGYLETYLNSGLAGLFLLGMLWISAMKTGQNENLLDSEDGTLRLAFFVTTLIYGFTEAIFDRPVMIWFILLLMFVRYAPPRKARTEEIQEPVQSHTEGVALLTLRDSI